MSSKMDRTLILNCICLYRVYVYRNHIIYIYIYGCSLQNWILDINISIIIAPKNGSDPHVNTNLPPRKKGLLQSCSQIQHCGDLRFRLVS